MLEELYRKYHSEIYHYLFRLTASEETAGNLTDKTFVLLGQEYKRTPEGNRLRLYLYKTATDFFISDLKKNPKRKIPIALYVTNLSEDISSIPGYRLKKSKTAGEIYTAFNSMPSQYGDAFVLKVYGELSYSEIAHLLEISEMTAKVICNRAKITLKEKIANEL